MSNATLDSRITKLEKNFEVINKRIVSLENELSKTKRKFGPYDASRKRPTMKSIGLSRFRPLN